MVTAAIPGVVVTSVAVLVEVEVEEEEDRGQQNAAVVAVVAVLKGRADLLTCHAEFGSPAP